MSDRKVSLKQERKPIKVPKQKRAAPDEETPATAAAAATAAGEKKRRSEAAEPTKAPKAAMEDAEEDEEGLEDEEFEDEYEDEYDEEERGEEAQPHDEDAEPEDDYQLDEEDDEGGNGGDGSMDMSDMKKALPVWLPQKDPLKKDEKLVFEPSAYDMLHRMQNDWPSLSFDILKDELGAQRTRFPHTVYVAAGTQAPKGRGNKVALMKAYQLHKTKHDKGDDDDDDSGESSGDESSDEDDGGDVDEDPLLEKREFAHEGVVNRLRSNPLHPGMIATWSDIGKVFVWDVDAWIKALDTPPPRQLVPTLAQALPHKEEGYALDWSPLVNGCLATGDCSSGLFIWRPRDASMSGWAGEGPFVGHGDSVEDIQWSPTEQAVLASCSVDRTIRIWDARSKQGALRSCNAHASDVNVISWNKLKPFLLASGCDDGTFRVWDLRNFKDGEPLSDFKYHTKPVTSIEWSPFEDSTIAVSSSDNSVTIWDLSLEADTEETKDEGDDLDVPPQLLFVHMGQWDIKELHWHPQIPNALVSTCAKGFHFWKPANLTLV